MIDYNKLKIAHELAIKWNKDALVSVQFWSNETEQYDFRLETYGTTEYLTGDIGDLIAKLQELTAHEPKYELGDFVWSLLPRGRQGLMKGFVDNSDGDTDKYYVLFHGEGAYWKKKEDLYPSRRSLIDTQIKYWQKLNCADGRHDWVENYSTGVNICVVCDERAQSFPVSIEQMSPPFEGEIKGFNNCKHDFEFIEDDVMSHLKCIKCAELKR